MTETPPPLELHEWPPVRVYTRQDLRTGGWTLSPYLSCQRIVERISPGISEAAFSFRAGTILHPDGNAFETIEPLEIIGHYVRVDLTDTADPEPAEEGETPEPLPPLKSFVFRIVAERSQYGGVSEDVAQPVTQAFTAVGLEHELDQIVVTGGFFAASEAESADALRATTPIAFNEKGRIGMTRIGNRSANRQAASGLPAGAIERAAYAFDQDRRGDGTLADVWTAADIIEYLLAFYVTKYDITSPLASYAPPPEEPDLMAEALQSIKPLRIAPEGLSVKRVLDELLRPEQGLAWRLTFPTDSAEPTEEAPVPIELSIISRLDETITLSETTIPANSDIISVDAVGDRGVLAIDVSETLSGIYGNVRVVGEPLLSCFTVSFADGTLVKDWTANDEFDYSVAGNPAYIPDPGIAELIQDVDSLQHVYQRFALPREWDGKAGDGKGGTKTLVNPVLESDGVISATKAALNRAARGLWAVLPIETAIRPADEEAAAANAKTYRPAFVLVQYPGDASGDPRRYAYSELGPPTGRVTREVGSVYLPVDRLAVQLQYSSPAVMANEVGWTKTTMMFGLVTKTFCATECVSTVALRTDQRLFATRSTPLATINDRELTIEVQGAELWLIAPGTVTGIDPTGQLINYTGPHRVRDDTQRLADVATLAAAWYGRHRQAAGVQFAGCRADLNIGQFMATAYKPTAEPVNLCLSEIDYDFAARTTVVAAANADLDFNRMGQ